MARQSTGGYGVGRAGGYRPPAPPHVAPRPWLGGLAQQFMQQQPQQQSQFQTPAMMQPGYDFSQDPALQRILATDAAARSNAQAAALAAEKQIAIQLGDAKGIIGDSNTAKEAANNPFSTLSQLRKGYGQQVWNTDQASNEQNLYYSGARAKAQAGNADTYQKNEYEARQAALNALATIQANLAAAQGGANQNDAAGYQQAYGNAVNQATTYGYNPGQQAPASSSVAGALAAKPAAKPATMNYPAALAASPAFRNLAGAKFGRQL